MARSLRFRFTSSGGAPTLSGRRHDTLGYPLPRFTMAPQATDELFVGSATGTVCVPPGAPRPAPDLPHGSVNPCATCRDQYGDVIPCNPYLNYFLRPSDLTLTNGRMPIFIPITQFFWNEYWQKNWENIPGNGTFFDVNGFLTANAAQILIDKNLLPSTATLTL